jgi:hypothetical protein
MTVEKTAIISMLRRIHLFRGMDDDTFNAAADLMEPVEIPSGMVIYKEGDQADFFYFILEGKVRILHSIARAGQVQQVSELIPDDYFGEEVLENEWPRQVSAETATDVILARLSVPHFIALLNLFPPLASRLQLILDSYHLQLKTRFDWLNPGETIYFVARRHVFFLLRGLLLPILVGMTVILISGSWFLSTQMISSLLTLVLSVIGTAGWLVWNYVDWSNDYYVITSERVIFQERIVLFYNSRQEAPLSAVQSTTINTTLWGRWLGYGNVAIRTYIGTIFFRNIAAPEQVQMLIQERQLHGQYYAQHIEIKNIREKMEKRIREGPEQPMLPLVKTQENPDPMRAFISTMFHLRYESGGSVTFRTHWFILLKKTFLPGLILVGLASLTLFNALHRFEYLPLQSTCGTFFLLGLVAFCWWFYQYLDWHNDVYIITPDQIVDVNKKPFGREERQSAPIKNILSIEFKRLGIIGLLLNFGTVYIRVGDQQLTFDQVFNPAEVQRELFHRLSKKNYEEKSRQIAEEERLMADWLATYHEWSKNNPPPRAPQPPTRPGF